MKRLVKWTVLLAVAAMPLLTGIAHAGAYENVLRPGEKLVPGQYLQSANGRFVFALDSHGELWLYDLNIVVPSIRTAWECKVLWHSGAASDAPSEAVMLADGNFVVFAGYAPLWGWLWMSNTSGNPGAFLVVQDDGNVVLYKWSVYYSGDFILYWPTVVWETGTAGG